MKKLTPKQARLLIRDKGVQNILMCFSEIREEEKTPHLRKLAEAYTVLYKMVKKVAKKK